MKMQVIAIQKKTRKSAFAILVKAVLPNPISIVWLIKCNAFLSIVSARQPADP
jgi:hypothetical protein